MVGSIDPRCETLRGTHWPVKVAGVFGTRVAENHLGQRSATASTGRTYGCKRSDQTLKNSCGTGAVHIWVPALRSSAKCAAPRPAHGYSPALGRDLVERHVLVDADIAGQAEHALGDDVAPDFISPPAMRIDGELKIICWNWPRSASSSSPLKTPAAPSRSIAYIAISCSIEPATSLPIEFSGPGRSPFDSAEIAR